MSFSSVSSLRLAIRWLPFYYCCKEFIIIPDIVIRIINIRGQYEQYRISGIFVLGALNHRGNIKTNPLIIKLDLIAAQAVVGHNRAGALYAYEHLVEFLVGMFTSNLLARHIKDDKITTRDKG